MIRPATDQDTESLAQVYRDSVRSIGPQAYSPEQVAMWARFPDDAGEFRSRLSRGLTLVADLGGEVVAFGQLDPEDHLALLYCCGRMARQGLCSRIYRSLEAHARARGVSEIQTEASRISRPFFEKHGFTVREVERVVRSGVEFERFRMSKRAPSR